MPSRRLRVCGRALSFDRLPTGKRTDRLEAWTRRSYGGVRSGLPASAPRATGYPVCIGHPCSGFACRHSSLPALSAGFCFPSYGIIASFYPTPLTNSHLPSNAQPTCRMHPQLFRSPPPEGGGIHPPSHRRCRRGIPLGDNISQVEKMRTLTIECYNCKKVYRRYGNGFYKVT